MNMLYQIAKPYIDQNDIDGVVNVLKSGSLSLGPKYQQFEKDLAVYAGSKFACTVANGTTGLHLAVRALGLKEGDEVITPSFSFVSSTNCLLFEHITPVFVDITEDSFSLDVTQIKKRITKRTKAILPVHLFGNAAPMKEIMNIAHEYGLKVLEDSCEGLGTRINNTQVGTMGDVGVFAFYPNKQMTTGEGGAIVTNNETIYLLCKSMRNQGRNNQGEWLVHERLGYNYRMDEMSASLGITQLKKLEWMIEQKQQIVEWYKECLSDCNNIILPFHNQKVRPAWFVYVIRVLRGKRNSLMQALTTADIQVKPYFPAIHLQPFIKTIPQIKSVSLPVTEKIAEETLALPFYIGLTKQDVKYICRSIKNLITTV